MSLIHLDEYHLLSSEDSSLDTGKTYQQDFQGYPISAKNKLLFIIHKKEIKLIELKNIGSTMGVFYVGVRAALQPFPLEAKSVYAASQLFEGWDEEKGEQYFFLPYVALSSMQEKNAIFEKLSLSVPLTQNEKGIIADFPVVNQLQSLSHEVQSFEKIPDILSFFFWLTLLYGKFEAKGEQLNSIKIHLPLFGKYLALQETLGQLIATLQEVGIFLQSSLNQNQGKMTLQITSNDYELLQIFAHRYSGIENFSQITKKNFTLQTTQQLIHFIEQHSFENAPDIKKLIEENVVKVLVK